MSPWKRYFKNPRIAFGSFFIFLLFIITIFSSYIAPYDPNFQFRADRLQGPSANYWMGTDEFGRDIFSRILVGSKTTLLISTGAVALAAICGVSLGILAGYFGGFIEGLIMRFMDILFSIPPVVLAIAMVAYLGSDIYNLILAIGILYTPRFARLVHGVVLSLKERQFVEASKALGSPTPRILWKNILPNTLAPVMVQVSLSLGFAILLESGLSFLGLGPPPPTPSWGRMVFTARGYLRLRPTMVIWPSLALAITILAFNLLGDGLRDEFDPKLRN